MTAKYKIISCEVDFPGYLTDYALLDDNILCVKFECYKPGDVRIRYTYTIEEEKSLC